MSFYYEGFFYQTTTRCQRDLAVIMVIERVYSCKVYMIDILGSIRMNKE
jgi:hypothetical protein